eukprot:5704991-Alexandrium_andersonii.AAC.1
MVRRASLSHIKGQVRIGDPVHTMAELVRDPYRTARLGTGALQNQVVQPAADELIGRPSHDTQWTASREDPAE